MEIFYFFFGILFAYTQHYLLLIFAVIGIYWQPKISLIFFFVLGLTGGFWHQYSHQPENLPEQAVIPSALVQGYIASIPHQTSSKTQFIFAVEQYNKKPAKALVQLAWYQNPPKLRAGQHWQLHVKLKKPRNFQNPGAFDYITALQKQHIYWTGYVKNKNNQLLTIAPSQDLLKFREYLGEQLSLLAPNNRTAGVIEALTLNLTHHLNTQEWDLFRRTGTIHLFGISGEHIALISGLVFWLSKRLWTLNARACLYLPAPTISSLLGLLVAFFYALLAGFEPPVQRALMGCFFYAFYHFGKQPFTPWQVWRYALFAVLCLEPHAVFMQGFYFSFLAVACILITHQRFRLNRYANTLALQLSCLIGLMPLTLFWYGYGSINGFLANLIAIPWVGFLIVPLALLVMLFHSWQGIELLMQPLAVLIEYLFKFLEWIEKLESFNLHWPIHSIELTIACMVSLLILTLLPLSIFRVFSLIWLGMFCFPPKLQIPPNEAQVNILDVGQGLAVAIHTHHHTLIYDTGDQFYKGSDLGKIVILPYLSALGIKELDMVIISHPDKDHRGGLRSLTENIPIHKLVVNEPRYYPKALPCHQYPSWVWDGIHFEFLALKKSFRNSNNNSCILQIRSTKGSVLLSADIEKEAEDELVKNYGKKLQSEVLLIPHHGSKTSSTYRFLLEVAPQFGIASLGLANRFRFPHKKTLLSLKALNIPLYRTDQCGMVQVHLPLKNAPLCFNRTLVVANNDHNDYKFVRFGMLKGNNHQKAHRQ